MFAKSHKQATNIYNTICAYICYLSLFLVSRKKEKTEFQEKNGFTRRLSSIRKKTREWHREINVVYFPIFNCSNNHIQVIYFATIHKFHHLSNGTYFHCKSLEIYQLIPLHNQVLLFFSSLSRHLGQEITEPKD